MSSDILKHSEILSFIERIRDSFPDSVEVYSKGSCVKFCLILLEVFPEGDILYNINHAVFEYNGIYYDITGDVDKKSSYIPLKDYSISEIDKILKLKYGNSKNNS